MVGRYYKFRSLQNFKRFIDIILNERLYASRYDELNDPMEGVYLTNPINGDIIRLLRAEKYKTRICSLSKDYRHTLLWSHYADSHRGCCIEISAVNEREMPTAVNYMENIPIIDDVEEGKNLLSHKSKIWEYENEVRYFRKTSYLNVRIHQIIFGLKVPNEDFRFYNKLIHAINPTIEIRKITKDELNVGYVL